MADEDKRKRVELALLKAKQRNREMQFARGIEPEMELDLSVPPELRTDTLRAADPESWRDWFSRGAGNVAGFITGKDPSEAARDVQSMLSIGDFAPVVGDVQSGADVVSDVQRGDLGSAAINTIATALPLVPGAKKLKQGRELLKGGKAGEKGGSVFTLKRSKAARERAKAQAAKEAPAEDEYDPWNVKPAKPAPAKKTGAITDVNLRHMPMEEAVKYAKKGGHIRPKEGGGFTGAPAQAQTMADVRRLRRQFDKDVGYGVGGADWYKRTHDWIVQVAGPDPAKQSELARNLALFSAQSDPKTNLGFAIEARNAAIMGEPASKVRTGAQATEYNRAFQEAAEAKAQGIDLSDPEARSMIGHNRFRHAPWELRLGKKTGIFGEHMDPTRESPTTGTNDIWHARALGYTNPKTGKPWEAALSPQQHAWMDAETVLAVDRANRLKLGGRSDWTPGEVQAAPWVYRKAMGLMERFGWDEQKAMAEATKTYPDYAEGFTAFGTHEITPGGKTGHRPDITFGSDAEKEAYASGPGGFSSWQGEGGRDILYDALGNYAGPSRPSQGMFTESGVTEFNPGTAATPGVTFTGPQGKKTLNPLSEKMMLGSEGFRAYLDAQAAGAGSVGIPGQRLAHSNAFEIGLPPDQDPKEAMRNALAVAKSQGVANPDVVNWGVEPTTGRNRAMVTDFMADPGIPQRGLGSPKEMSAAMQQAGLGSATPIRREGVFAGYYDPDFNSLWEQGGAGGGGIGSGVVTRKLLDEFLTPAHEAAFDADPRIAEAALAKFERDAAVDPSLVRPDVQNAREIVARGMPDKGIPRGIAGLKIAVDKGLLPVAAIGVMLPYLLGGEQQEPQT